ncbi:MAG: amidohydrolase [Chloroflexi bacterium HGW-Chloroflexi-6]|nr:MAG: amidohydrolase [Chloroflexi bacterium HGW-Chloroflexi-6]
MKILFNAHIHTLDQIRPYASVLVIDRERIAAIGGEELIASFGARASREDMGGRVILPGLTDAHIHLMNYALSLQKVNVETSTKQECLRRVAERAQATPPGAWILGHGWQQNDWGGEFGIASDLDQAAPHNPVYLTAKSLHAGWANSATLKLAGITVNTPDPENGKILRNAGGQPTGILLESAMGLIESALPQPSVAEAADAIRAAIPTLYRIGLTGAHDFDYRTAFMALQLLRESGDLRLRVIKSVPPDLLEHAHALGLRSGFGDDILRIGSYKNFMDGALGPRTAAMFQPYLNDPENRGILNLDGEELLEMGRKAADSGLSMAVHAIGDRAVHEVLNAYEQLRAYERQHGLPRLRHRIEHVQIIHPDDVGRLAELGVIASMQPVHAVSDMLAADRFWGDRARLAYAPRTQLEAGAPLAFGSDAPVESPNPFLGLHAAVTRRRADGSPGPEGWYPEQRLSMAEALAGFTTGAAYAAGMEDRLGRLSPGYYADLIVLEEDPLTCPPDVLLTMQTFATMLGGEWVWQS